MPSAERVMLQNRASRRYEAKSTPPSLLHRDINPSCPPFATTTSQYTGPENGTATSNSSSSNSSSSDFFGNSSSSSSFGSIFSDDKCYFPFDIKTKTVFPVMPPDATHQFALTAVGQWLENYRGITRQRKANNTLSEYCMKLCAGDEPELMLCLDGMHKQSSVRFNSGSSKYQTIGVGYYFQFCKHKVNKLAVHHYRLLSDPLPTTVLEGNPWLAATLVYRTRLAPVKRGPRLPKKTQKNEGKQTNYRLISPEVLPHSPPRPVESGVPTAPVITRSLSERTDVSAATTTVIISPRSATYTPERFPSPHENASPPSTPSDASRSISQVEADRRHFDASRATSQIEADRCNFNASEYSEEIHRRRRAGLPLPHGQPEVEIPIRFYLPDTMFDTDIHVNKMGRTCLKWDEEHLVEMGFPLAAREYVWMLVPYTETDPIWQKVAWGDVVSVGGALSLTFMVEKDGKRFDF